LAGDALLTIAFEIATHAKPVSRYDLRDVLREIAEAAGSRKLIAGQVADLEAERQRISRRQVRSIHENKTAALLTASVRLGAMAANAIIVALSVQRRGGAVSNRAPALRHSSVISFRNAWLQLTPPLIVTRVAPHAFAARRVFFVSTSTTARWKDAHMSRTNSAVPF